MSKTVIGLYENAATARQAVDALIAAGFRREEIDLREPDAYGVAAPANEEKREGGFLSWLFGEGETQSREEDDIYAEGLRRGRALVSVNAQDENSADRAGEILNDCDPIDLRAESEGWRNEGWSGKVLGESASIPVVDENVEIGKRAVERGRVRVYSRVVSRPVEADVSLRQQKVEVERRPVDRPLAAGEAAFQERSLEMKETGEEAVVSKTSRVVEEVKLSQSEEELGEHIEDTERHTEVEVEHLPPGTAPKTHPRP